jgi:hypothetical protein
MARKIGRSAITGRFQSVAMARARPNTSVVEVIKSLPPKKKD